MLCPKCDKSGIEVTTFSDSIRKYICCNQLCINAMYGVVYDGELVQSVDAIKAFQLEKKNEMLVKVWAALKS